MPDARRPEKRYSAHFKLDDAPTIAVNVLNKATFATTHLRCDQPGLGMTAPHDREDAFLVSVQLKDFESQRLWCNGHEVPTYAYKKGTVGIYDLKEEWLCDLQSSFDVLHFHVPRSSLEALADTYNSKVVDFLDCSPTRGRDDPIVQQLANLLLPPLDDTSRVDQLFTGHILLALHEHLATAYGGFMPGTLATKGTLAPWQEKRAKDFMNSHLSEDISLEQVAAECRLSASYFMKAFKRTTGSSPHAWLISQRIDAAMQMIRVSGQPLADIAVACGFGDQSHLTRIFSGHVGVSPGKWRRLHTTASILAQSD